ncbi:hypothetical protein BKK79_31935 [Cupriavidus sp. USMAA2-4]|uniref:hypothetical protein n=1 Tax=Cupriavidus sp. USMAA2-4 TaxID=876364 RepID=UPI0008A6C141|nr:hypothetical protein [Cupriavidus sp. USMAA2-4]AOY96228.1 hypothetical protein BKK79_31935 [Cupriavidus sp. USMAA2-4]
MRSTQRPATAGATDLPALPASPSLAIARSICLQPVCARPYQTSGPRVAEVPERVALRHAASARRYGELPKTIDQTARRLGTFSAWPRKPLVATA